MPPCPNCGAAIAPDSPFCLHCGHRTQVQLDQPRDFYRFEHGRNIGCPDCHAVLTVMPLAGPSGLAKGWCTLCNSGFYPPGALELELGQASARAAFHDQKRQKQLGRIVALQNKRPPAAAACPVCQQRMQQEAFSHWFRLAVNRCEQHGYWLQAKHVSLLRDWRAAGGHLAKPLPTRELLRREVAAGSTRIFRLLLCMPFVLGGLWLMFMQTARSLQGKYELCGRLFDEDFTGTMAPDYALQRARGAQACVLENAGILETTVIVTRKRLPLENLPHAPCAYVGSWSSVRENAPVYRVTMKGNGEFIAFPQAQSRLPDSPRLDDAQLLALFKVGAYPQAIRGFWGEHEGRLIWLYENESHPPDLNPISQHTSDGFTLLEQDGETQTRFSRLQTLGSTGEAGCVR
ncbi:zinc-ribbon domain-containing protein [Chitinilyticum piscinae]|nr:zinc-ribbon domain-containing protein [Chitinilyticum piscinae]